jgi:SAM-dependent methyltransferase
MATAISPGQTAPIANPLRPMLASPCHQSGLLPDDPWNPHSPKLRCAICGREFHARDGVYDFRLAPLASAAAAGSFEAQWRRRQRGDFERDTLYGADATEELDAMLRAFGVGVAALDGSWILDAGCGVGRLGANLARLGANVVSLDVTDAVRQIARGNRLPNSQYLQADLMHPPLRTQAFDYVWSAGVLHHTEAPRKGFDRLAALVRPGGHLAVWLYSAERFSPFLAARRMIPFAHRMPDAAASALCLCLAVPLYLAGSVAPLFGRRRLPLSTVRFGLYDSLTPRYQSRHTEREMRAWFETNGFVNIRKWSELGLTGERSR